MSEQPSSRVLDVLEFMVELRVRIRRRMSRDKLCFSSGKMQFLK